MLGGGAGRASRRSTYRFRTCRVLVWIGRRSPPGQYRPPETGDGEVAAAALRNYLRSIARGEAKARYLNWRGFPDRLKRFWAKRKGLVVAGAAVVVLLFVAIGRACAGGDDEEKEKEE